MEQRIRPVLDGYRVNIAEPLYTHDYDYRKTKSKAGNRWVKVYRYMFLAETLQDGDVIRRHDTKDIWMNQRTFEQLLKRVHEGERFNNRGTSL